MESQSASVTTSTPAIPSTPAETTASTVVTTSDAVEDTSNSTAEDATATTVDPPDSEETQTEDFPPTFSWSLEDTAAPHTTFYRSSRTQTDRDRTNVNVYLSLLAREQVYANGYADAEYISPFANLATPSVFHLAAGGGDERSFIERLQEQEERDRQRLRVLAPVFTEFLRGVLDANIQYQAQRHARDDA